MKAIISWKAEWLTGNRLAADAILDKSVAKHFLALDWLEHGPRAIAFEAKELEMLIYATNLFIDIFQVNYVGVIPRRRIQGEGYKELNVVFANQEKLLDQNYQLGVRIFKLKTLIGNSVRKLKNMRFLPGLGRKEIRTVKEELEAGETF